MSRDAAQLREEAHCNINSYTIICQCFLRPERQRSSRKFFFKTRRHLQFQKIPEPPRQSAQTVMQIELLHFLNRFQKQKMT